MNLREDAIEGECPVNHLAEPYHWGCVFRVRVHRSEIVYRVPKIEVWKYVEMRCVEKVCQAFG